MVVANAVAALSEINESSPTGSNSINRSIATLLFKSYLPLLQTYRLQILRFVTYTFVKVGDKT